MSDTHDDVVRFSQGTEEVGLEKVFTPMEAAPSNVTYNDEADITDSDRERVCQSLDCADHEGGTTECPVPKTWGELRDQVGDDPALSIPSDRRVVDPDDNVFTEPTAVDVHGKMRKQPTPDETSCPYCGGEPTHESDIKHHLSAMGYRHDDQHLECEDCGRQWPLGVPIGEYDGKYAEDLYCESCEERYMKVHRVQPLWATAQNSEGPNKIRVHMKCPNCYFFKKILRPCDNRGTALMGYPSITGDVDGAEPDGYLDPDDVQ